MSNPAMKFQLRQNGYASSANTPRSNPSSSTEVSADITIPRGNAAGIGASLFVAGIVVALIGAFISNMLRKRRKSSPRTWKYPQEDSDIAIRGPQTHNAGVDVKLDEYLLETVPDSDVSTAVQVLATEIELHVDNGYHMQPVPESSTVLMDALERCFYDEVTTGISVSKLQALLAHPQSRTAALRHVIGWFIFSRLSLGDDLNGSLLPPQVAAFIKAIPPPDSSPDSRQAFDLAFFKWRTTSAFLLHSSRRTRGPITLDLASVDPIIESDIYLLNQVLGPFIHPTADSHADQLRNIMANAAKLGLLLFSQPTTWDFGWTLSHTNSNGIARNEKQGSNKRRSSNIVVVPQCAKTTDRQGRPYSQPRVVLESESVEL